MMEEKNIKKFLEFLSTDHYDLAKKSTKLFVDNERIIKENDRLKQRIDELREKIQKLEYDLINQA